LPRPRRKAANDETREQIKQIARSLMAEKGTSGLSLRAIARQMDMSASALYHYYGSMDDLITALIVDAFTAHADAIRIARDTAAAEGATHAAQLVAAAKAYRAWALENPSDFQLIYGNPIPGYEAPFDVTQPAASQTGQVFMETLTHAVRAGELTLPDEAANIPPNVERQFRQQLGTDAEPIVVEAFHVLNRAWGMLHGMTSLEVHNHLQPVVGDTDAFYESTLRSYFRSLGLNV